tara:strand:+ start:1011 stop:1256 length:246 start_codon:yes stop_codon:yes gene_type:complete
MVHAHTSKKDYTLLSLLKSSEAGGDFFFAAFFFVFLALTGFEGLAIASNVALQIMPDGSRPWASWHSATRRANFIEAQAIA